MKIILQCTNLLGDSLYLLKPIEVFLQQTNLEDVCCIVADKGLPFELFDRTFKGIVAVTSHLAIAQQMNPDAVVLDLNAGRSGEWCHNTATPTNQPHISEGYAHFLGVDLKGDLKPPMKWEQINNAFLPRTFFAISPFSKSCSRHSGQTPNKTLDDFKWEFIIRYLRRQGLPVKVIAGPNDRLKDCSVPLNDYFTAKNLYELEYFLKSCALLISLDNGLGHIASLLDTPMISLWPKVSNHQFIAPRFSDKTAFVLMDPVTAQPSQLLAGIRQFAKILLGVHYAEEEVQR